MNVTLDRKELLAVAKRAASVAPSVSPLDTLRGVLLETDSAGGLLTISATNLEVAIEQKIRCAPQDDDALVINADIFERMLAKLAGESVILQRSGKTPRLTITSADACFEGPIWERGSFPKVEIPFPEDTVKLAGLPALTKRTVFAVGNAIGKPLLKCVNLMFTKDGLKAACSNGNCIVTAQGDAGSARNVSMLVPAMSLDMLRNEAVNRGGMGCSIPAPETPSKKPGISSFSGRQIVTAARPFLPHFPHTFPAFTAVSFGLAGVGTVGLTAFG